MRPRHSSQYCPNPRSSRRRLVVAALRLLALSVITVCLLQAPAAAASPAAVDERVAAMKSNPKGPFLRIRWFCNDGTILPPEPGACREHDGGAQHGELTQVTKDLRDNGYRIANIYADLDIDSLLAEPRLDRSLAQMAVEQFLRRIDDGWIFRRALHYRGALQEEGERAGAKRLLLRLAADSTWVGPRFLAWRSLAALLPHGSDSSTAQAVRQNASMLAQREPAFLQLKNKIHISPAKQDAASVRAFAVGVDDAEVKADFARLADDIDALYAVDTVALIKSLATSLASEMPELARMVDSRLNHLTPSGSAEQRLSASADLLAEFRRAVVKVTSAKKRLALIDASIAIEATHFVAASELNQQATPLSRAQLLQRLSVASQASFGVGLLSQRQLTALTERFTALDVPSLALTQFRAHIDTLALATGWADRNVQFNFADGMAKLATLDSLANLFIQDHLRGSPMFFYAENVDRLLRDANQLAGVQHRLFGQTIGGGLRGLNPGIARGVLRDGRGLEVGEFAGDGIYLLPETTADLPPVAGILTAGEGNPLSHVQLLARNLGIPNVSVSAALLDQLSAHENQAVVLAVSASGAVHILADNAEFDHIFEQSNSDTTPHIEAELDKLQLQARDILDLGSLRADDSGRTVGPKAAKLGELKAHYPAAVADGLALPFGLFRELLERQSPDGERDMYAYIVAGYRQLEQLPSDSPQRVEATEIFRRSLEQWVDSQTLSQHHQTVLRQKLLDTFGEDGSFGVFVRSDTNVEDLPGFTGAGLNLTVANVVGIDAIIAAIPRVWASPFTARAFSWRQALMRQPEHVYPAVLLLESVNADKSGVLVTQNIDTGDRDWLSVAVNEGVGGAVDGQSAESLRIHLPTGEVRLLAQASASIRRQVNLQGGVEKLPASGTDTVLEADEIEQLIAFAKALPEQFPAIVDADGKPAPADVEFGFQNGQLRLFQIRPFLDNAAARSNQYLIDMDGSGESNNDQLVIVNLALNPGTAPAEE